MSRTNYKSDKRSPMSNGVKSEGELLKLRLEKLAQLLDFKNRTYCKKYLKKIIEDFFSEKNDGKQEVYRKR